MLVAKSVKDMNARNKERLKSARENSKKAEREHERLKTVMADEADAKLQQEARAFMENDQLLSRLAASATSARNLLEVAMLATVKASTEETVAAVARAYSYWILSQFDERYNILALHIARKRKRIGAKTTKLHLFVEAMISHGGSDARLNSQLCNRDVQAIRWLNNQKITPSDVIHLSREKGEGLDAWARRWPDVQRAAATQATSEELPDGVENHTDTPLEEAASTTETTLAQSDIKEAAKYEQEEQTKAAQPDYVIDWQDNLTNQRRTFRIKQPSGKSGSDLDEIKLMLETLEKTWAFDGSSEIASRTVNQT